MRNLIDKKYLKAVKNSNYEELKHDHSVNAEYIIMCIIWIVVFIGVSLFAYLKGYIMFSILIFVVGIISSIFNIVYLVQKIKIINKEINKRDKYV